MAKTWKSHKPWEDYPLRVCRYMNECAICKNTITSGQEYYDGGFNLRAHKKCVEVGKRYASKFAPTPDTMPGNDKGAIND